MTLLLLPWLASPAAACEYDDCHSDGAVSLPGELELHLPFEEGERVQVLSGYGPSAGSSLHCRARDSQCANDYYALDLVLPDHSNSGKGEPVVAVADGTVIDADWGSSGWANYGQRVYLEHEPGDGHSYTSMYAHLHSIDVSKGQRVSAGQRLGTLGQSCNGELSCDSFSTPHLHFALHRDSGFGGSGSGGSYGGRAVIPEPVDGYSGISRNDVLISGNGEDDPTEPDPEPTACLVAATGETVIEEEADCVSRTGSTGDFHDADGHAGHAWWTPVDVEAPDYAEGAIWSVEFESAGDYTLEAWVPADLDDLTTRAIYKVQFDGQTEKAWPDQSSVSATWLPIGTFAFSAGGDQWIRLGDNQDDGAQSGRRVVFDALRFAPATAEVPDTEVHDTEARDTDTLSTDDSDSPIDPGDIDGDQPWDDGCGCSARPAPTGPLVWLLAVAGWRRRSR